MESKVNYTIVGLFVVILLGLLAGFFYWLSHYGYEKRYDYYRINSSGSVSGLNVESPVKFQGLLVGTVYSMGINPKNSSEIEVIIQVEKDTPIKVDTKAMVAPQGITGLSFIELIGNSKDALRLNTSAEKIANIGTHPSMLVRFEKQFNGISLQMSSLLDKFNILLEDKNINNFSNLLEQSTIGAERIKILLNEKRFSEIDNVLINLKEISNSLKKETPKLGYLLDNTNMTVKGFSKNSQKLQLLLEDIELRLHNGEFNFKDMSLSTFDTLHSLSRELHSLSAQTRQSLQSFDNSPSDIFFKSNTIPPGPGEH